MPSESASPPHFNTLPAGTRLAEFELRAIIGTGGFGIVYRAFDTALEREVAIKEYMPVALAMRQSGQLTVAQRSAGDADLFSVGLRSFVNEARLLARFDHPSLIKVYRFWEQYGTAYMVMPLYRGRTLKQACDAGEGPADEAALLRVVLPVLGSLEVLHSAGVYHRDVTPDNILLGDDGVPVLLDFGAARRVVGEQTQPLTSILKPRFAPIEQYADVSHLPQGPWTDLYSLGAVMRFVITGVAPIASAARAIDDQLAPLSGLEHARFGAPLRRAIDWSLALRPQQRPQSVAGFRDALEGRIEVPACKATLTVLDVDPSQWPVPTAAAVVASASPQRPPVPAEAAVDASPQETQNAPAGQAPPFAQSMSLAATAPELATPSRHWRWIGGAVVVVCLSMLSWLQQQTPPSMRAHAAAIAPPKASPAAEAPPSPPVADRTNNARRTTGAGGAHKTPAEPVRRAAAAAPAEAASPSQACGERVFLARALCLQRECAKPRFREHAHCVQMRNEMAERRERVAQP